MDREVAIAYLSTKPEYTSLFDLDELDTGTLVTMALLEEHYGPTTVTLVDLDIRDRN